MDNYAADLAAVTAHLDLKNAIHVGHSTGGGEVVHYVAGHESRVLKAAIISAVPPLMVKTDANPNGLPKKVFDDFQVALAANRSGFYRDIAAGPFYNYNRPGANPSEATIQNWRRQGALRRHRRVLADRFHRRSQEDHRSCAGHAQRRRPDRALRRRRAALRQAAEARHAEDLQGLPARHADHRGRYHQRRPAGFHPRLRIAQYSTVVDVPMD